MQSTAKKFLPGMLEISNKAFAKGCDANKYIQALNTNKDGELAGYISVFSLPHKERWSLNVSEAYKLDSLKYLNDVYCSVNSLYCPGRHTSKYVKKLNALFLDLDYYNIERLKGLTAQQVAGLMESELDYPIPSFYVDSGRGLYVIWVLENTYATTGSKKFWKKLEKDLVKYFQDFGADAKCADVARVLRVIGTKNSKSNTFVKIIPSPNFVDTSNFETFPKYELSDFAELLWEVYDKNLFKEKEETKKKKRKQTNKVIQLRTTQTLNYYRCQDLETLVSLRKDVNIEGCREKLLFLYRLHLIYSRVDPDVALNETLALNSKFTDSLDTDEVIDATATAEGVGQVYLRLVDGYKEEMGISLNQHLSNGGVYIYKNSTIIRELNITTEEQKHLKVIIGPEEKRERRIIQNKEYYSKNASDLKENRNKKYKEELKKANKLSREEQNKQKIEDIKKLLSKGLTQSEIAAKLGLGIATVKRHIKEIKKINDKSST